MYRHITQISLFLCMVVLLVGCSSPQVPEKKAVSQPTGVTTVLDEVQFTGLIGWAKHPTDNAYWAFLVDADCDDAANPSPPGIEICSDQGLAEDNRHEPFLLFHNAVFTGQPVLLLKKMGVFVNVKNTVEDEGEELEGISLKGRKVDFDLSPETLSTKYLENLISEEDVSTTIQPGWKFEIDRSLFTLDPGKSDKDYLQAAVIVDSGELVAADSSPLDCKEQPQPDRMYGLTSDTVTCAEPKYYSEDLFLYGDSGEISFQVDGTSYTVGRVDSTQPIRLYVLNVHPQAWLALKDRDCSTHHAAFRWFYGLTKEPAPGDTNNHFFTCDDPDAGGTAANRRCPNSLFN